MEIMKIFIKESKIMNDSNLQLNYFILLELSIAQLFFFFLWRFPTESEIFANATNQTSNNNEETGNQEETAISKNQNCTKILLG